MSERKKCKVLGVEFEQLGDDWGRQSGNVQLTLCDAGSDRGWYAELNVGHDAILSGPDTRTESAAYRALLALLSDDLKDKWPEVLRPPGERAKRGGK